MENLGDLKIVRKPYMTYKVGVRRPIDMHTTDMYFHLKWLPPDHRLELSFAVMAFKYINGLLPINICLPPKNSETHTSFTRNPNKFVLNRNQTRSFGSRAAKLWNSLDEETISLENVGEFKYKYKLKKGYLQDNLSQT